MDMLVIYLMNGLRVIVAAKSSERAENRCDVTSQRMNMNPWLHSISTQWERQKSRSFSLRRYTIHCNA